MQVATKRALNTVLRNSRTSTSLLRRSATSRVPNRSAYVCYRCSYLHLSARLRTQVPSAGSETAATAESRTPSSSKDVETGSQAASSPSRGNEDSTAADDTRSVSDAEVSIPSEVLSAIRPTTTGGEPSDPEQPDKRPSTRTSTAKLKSTRKSTRPKEEPLPKIDLPEWFLERAVFLPEELAARESRLDVSDRYGSEVPLDEERGSASEDGKSSGDSREGSGGGPSKETDVEMELLEAGRKAEAAASRETPLLTEEGTAEADKILDDADTKAESPEKPDPESPSSSSTPLSDPASDSTTTPPNASSDTSRSDIAFFTPSLILDTKYGISPAVWSEIWSIAKATLTLPKPAFNQAKVARTVDCILLFPQTPETNGTYFLDAVSEDLAQQLGATLIRIDAEDVAEIAGDYVETSATGKAPITVPTPLPSAELRTLGYDAQFIHPNNRPRTEEEEVEEEEVEEAEETEVVEADENAPADFEDSPRPFRAEAPNFMGIPISFIRKFTVPGGVISLAAGIGGKEPDEGLSASSFGFPIGSPPGGAAVDVHPRLQAVLELMLDSGIKKREGIEKIPKGSATLDSETQTAQSNRTIVQVRDFKELQSVPEGRTFLNILRKLVYERRLEGREIMILGNSATVSHGLDLNSSYLTVLQGSSNSAASIGILERTIVVPPQPWDATRDMLERDRKARIREINMRHLKAMITRRSGDDGHAVTLEVPKDWHFENLPKVENISDWIWDLDAVHRLTLTILGSVPGPGEKEVGPRVIGPGDVASAIQTIKRSDKAKVAWSTAEAKYAEEREAAEEDEPSPEEERAAKLRKLKGKCNKHEKRLLGGVIDPSGISTGFDQVRAAVETVDALKTLTSLSLLRPEAFSYGVLAQDKIPGVLLYGPPGTGKTLLAKAVAKESGATVLEVSGSEVYDMYVGEGEKNVKAIFSLAKKLSPCVVFIDEADAIFGARTGHHQRTSHRELINQFLKEWDGMAKMSAFIMVATNRPFDLDDAVLRRLPRRVLIDLPTAEDRLAILNIHLNGETLDADVDLKSIASDERTNLYSGSDLKNVAVSAALAAVKEEDVIFKETGSYPEKRTLKAKHFEQALGEISASISDDMGSLGMIRKFDEKYGDRKGRKKKINKWGFGGVAGEESVKEKGTGRVRN
ncbi:hypothetical protein TWF106_007903 [Orbilia oligospora]|uniref:AAA+ ATPase domain-containing protein n=1 Tax=Orbilia oligospora TaxID=2813651 RepID=A0A7C8UTV0_ORBOL|nr:hypothetical protein TWF106_007903 [Orbilia oligospora]